MAVKSIRVLCSMVFPGKTVRLWDGAGPYLDAGGEVWLGAALGQGLDQIESAMNGEAATLMLALSGVDGSIADLAYEDLEAGKVIDAPVQLMIQDCDEWDQPIGLPEVRFTGAIDNMPIDDAASGDSIVSNIVAEIRNRFSLRSLINGGVLSDVNRRAVSAIINPGATADRIAERITILVDKTIVWPRFS